MIKMNLTVEEALKIIIALGGGRLVVARGKLANKKFDKTTPATLLKILNRPSLDRQAAIMPLIYFRVEENKKLNASAIYGTLQGLTKRCLEKTTNELKRN